MPQQRLLSRGKHRAERFEPRLGGANRLSANRFVSLAGGRMSLDDAD
jgi:hypothetical protein